MTNLLTINGFRGPTRTTKSPTTGMFLPAHVNASSNFNSSTHIPLRPGPFLKPCRENHTKRQTQYIFKSAKMFSSRVLIAVAFASATLAAPKLEITSVAADNATCWYFLPDQSTPRNWQWQFLEQIANIMTRLGDIGEPCYGHGNGCSRTGAKASCSYSSDSFLSPWLHSNPFWVAHLRRA